ncbi:helix-turn-helix domain-containing protein [Streptomyces griseoviridis]|uniref:helix-turn-helix domain-containing protein n=1 Tax=Streptomyces TaxID=1883 RepID=UPI002475EEC7|nr:helix-turn-helix domain-containing protein [Streptomyces sp. MAA16]
MAHSPDHHTPPESLRERAVALRLQGWSYDRIKEELGCSKSSVSLWVRHLPRPDPGPARERARAASRRRWDRESALRDEERRRAKAAGAAEVGSLSDRELFIAGVALYWAEGSKDKPHRRSEVLQFINSDPQVIRLFLRWLESLGVGRERLTLRVSIHETADVRGAERFWAGVAGVDVSVFSRATLKRHNPRTVRKNTGDGYHGCLVLYVRQSADLYRRMEGAWYGIVLGVDSAS